MKNTCKHLRKTAIMLFMSVALLLTMWACLFMDTIYGSGNIVAEVHDLSEFSAIKAGGASDVLSLICRSSLAVHFSKKYLFLALVT